MCLSPLPYSGPKTGVCSFVRPFAPPFPTLTHLKVEIRCPSICPPPLIFDAFTIGLYLARDNFGKYFYILQKEIQKLNQLNSTECILLTHSQLAFISHMRISELSGPLGRASAEKFHRLELIPGHWIGYKEAKEATLSAKQKLYFVKIISLSSLDST